MAKVQIARTEATRAVAKLQIARTEATVPAAAAGGRLQIARTEATTSASSAPVITSATISDDVTDPLDVVTMTLTVSGSFNQVVWSQQATPAPLVDTFGSDLVKSFIAPADVDGTTVTFAVTVTGPGGTSDPAFLSVDVGPQVEWYLPASGPPWAPLSTTQIVA